MQKLLTIAIPTYNRAALLDKQLAWLAIAIKGFESECEIIISDNCSTDNTPGVVKKWQSVFSNTVFIANRNRENIGLMPNIAFCLQAAGSKYVWTVGDDDPIQERTLAHVVTTIKRNPSLSLMFLNCCGRDHKTNQVLVKHWFPSDSDEIITNSKPVFEQYLQNSFGGVLFMTATIYKTELVQQALQQWTTSCKNLASQAYWTGFCAAHGNVIVTQDNYLECTMHASSLEENPRWSLMMRYVYIPEIYLKLLSLGYSAKFCQRMILENIFKLSDWKILFGALRRWPVLATNIIITYLQLVGKFIYQLNFNQQKSSINISHLSN
ncbi:MULTISPECIES: glycosyltransferase family 2 protein [Nostocales]|uniref:glycosyltransferase family 2 protein n=1 Tax=Nostocales TaxID=1161 RepID=UPI00029B77C2|nr:MULTISPECIES: glycosyltransferase family 2 protein [Nostocales]AFW92840.1 glycosyltransferase family 2 protein [Anabaena sp. 90]MTJ17737.1 glycosyltransferase family 2 protein [Dolichospermum sp. UHCC 0299]MTJ22189.1 glycosyltransferase family 2 protein [Dolichospermum sp. UHCC 0352]MTJ38086.1 glycosyltransferase family 2 protein [Dolichospermum sp. UHCC 0406]